MVAVSHSSSCWPQWSLWGTFSYLQVLARRLTIILLLYPSFNSSFFYDYSCAYDLCKATEIMSVADAMASNGMKELGYEYINLDGTYILACFVFPSFCISH